MTSRIATQPSEPCAQPASDTTALPSLEACAPTSLETYAQPSSGADESRSSPQGPPPVDPQRPRIATAEDEDTITLALTSRESDTRVPDAPGAAPTSRPASREPRFLRYLAGQSVSLLGDQIWSVALSWSAVHMASAAVAGLLLTLSSLPRLALMLFGGVIADRFDVRRLMIGSDVLRSVITIVAAAIALAQPGIALLAVLSLVFGLVDAVFMPAAGSMQPRLLAQSQYAGAAVLTNLASRAALSIGAPLGGILVAAGGVPLALTVDAVTFVVSVLALATVHPRPITESTRPAPSARPVVSSSLVPSDRPAASCVSAPSTQVAASTQAASSSASASSSGSGATSGRSSAAVMSGRSSYGADLRDGLRFLVRHRVLGPMTLAFLLLNIGFVGPMNVGIAELAAHRGWGAAGIGVLLTGFGVGSALGGLLTPRLRIRRNAGCWISLLGVVQGLGLLSVAFVPDLGTAALLTGWVGLTSGPMAVLASVIQQSETPDAYRGRVSSISTLLSLGVVPLASAATGLVIGAVGLRADFTVSGLIESAALITLLAPGFRSAQVGRR